MDTRTLLLILGITLVAGYLTWIPVHAGYTHAQENGNVFNGFDFTEDSQAYAGYIHSGVEENVLLLQDYSTSEEQEPVYIVLLFSLLAFIVKLGNIPIDLVWHASRFAIALFLGLCAYTLSTVLFKKNQERMIGIVLLFFGGGFGWTQGIFGEAIPLLARLQSTDLVYYLGYTVFGFLFHPLAMLSLAFLFLEAYFLLRFWEKPTLRLSSAAALMGLLAFFNHPAAGVLGLGLGGLVLAQWFIQSTHFTRISLQSRIPFLLPAIAAGIITLLYVVWARGEPVYLYHQTIYTEWARQEPIWMYPFALGIPLLAALVAIFTRARFDSPRVERVLLTWLALALVLANFFPAGVKYLYLIFPALIWFAVLGIRLLATKLSARLSFFTPKQWMALGVLLACLSVPFIINLRTTHVVEKENYYHSIEEEKALVFLETQGKGIVLSEARIGSLVTWRSPQRPFLAHSFLTLNFDEKREIVHAFFDSRVSIEEKREILEQNGITHVFYGPDEQKLGAISPGLPLELLFEEGDVTLFRVD